MIQDKWVKQVQEMFYGLYEVHPENFYFVKGSKRTLRFKTKYGGITDKLYVKVPDTLFVRCVMGPMDFIFNIDCDGDVCFPIFTNINRLLRICGIDWPLTVKGAAEEFFGSYFANEGLGASYYYKPFHPFYIFDQIESGDRKLIKISKEKYHDVYRYGL